MSAEGRAHGRRTRATLVAALALVFTPALASALDSKSAIRQYLIDWWDESADLPHNNVKSILQTRSGYLWIGTKGGLARFDGVRFTSYDDRVPNQLQESEVWSMVEDDDGGLWIGTFGGGLTRLKDGVFTTQRASPDGLPSAFVTTLARGADGELWIGSELGLSCLKDGRFSSYGTKDGLPAAEVRALHLDSSGVLWIGTTGGLATREAGRIVNQGLRFPGRFDRRVTSIASQSANDVWIAVPGIGVVRMRGDELTELGVRDGLSSDIANKLLIDAQGVLWAGTTEGLCRLRGGRFEAYASDFPTRSASGLLEAASLRSVQALATDREGSLWIGTTLDGLARLRDGAFAHLRQAEGLPNEDARSVFVEDGGAVWVGTATGVVRIAATEREAFSTSQGLRGNQITTVSGDRDGSVWIGSTQGLSRIRNGRVDPAMPAGLDRIGIQAVLRADDGTVWIGTQANGLLRMRGGELTPIRPEEGPAGRLVRALAIDPQGIVWVGAKDGGLWRVLGDHLVSVPLGDGTGQVSVHGLFADSDGALWVATRHGLKREKDGRAVTLTAQQGLSSNFIYGFVDDGRGDLWMTYGSGIMRVSKRELNAAADGRVQRVSCVSYGTEHGLLTTAMSLGRQNATYRSGDGRLWFATGRGVAIADPGKMPINELPPPVWVEDIVVDGVPHGLPEAAAFGPGDGRVEIRYTALSFLAPDRVRFKRMLEGFDEDWVDAGTRRVAYFTNLPPRSYRFRVKACNKDGMWNEVGASFSFVLVPRWYQTPLARLLGLLVVALAILGGHRLRVARLRASERELGARVQERTSELRQEIEKHRETAEHLKAEASERARTQEELEQLNEELGVRVSQRTAQLATTNEELSAEKERLAVTLRSIGDGVIATDVSGIVVLLNRVAEELVGWPRGEAIGRPVREVFRLVERWTRKALPNPVELVIRSEKAVDIPGPALLLSRSGHELLVADSVAPIRDRQSRITGAVLVFRDVTERVRTEEHLANVGKLESLQVLAGGIAHDFNNLLAGLFGYIDLATLGAPEGSIVHQRLSKALAVLERARGLSGQLLTFTGQGSPITAPTDIGALLREGARFALAGSNVTSEISIAGDLWQCEVDAGQMAQVIDNLLINARQAMPEGGRVDVRAENVTTQEDPILPDGRYVRLTIRDGGAGIPVEHRDRVFDPFFTTKPKGTGLGLATSHAIVKRHRGHIEFESVVGEGTSFRVFLPAARSGESLPAVVPATSHALDGRVLVMDDEAAIREILHDALEGVGLRVVAVADANAAVQACQAALEAGQPFDVAILDLTIVGGLGGVGTLALLRARQPSLAAIASSGYSSDPVMADPERFGFQRTLVKPCLIAGVLKTVEGLLAGRGTGSTP